MINVWLIHIDRNTSIRTEISALNLKVLLHILSLENEYTYHHFSFGVLRYLLNLTVR